MTRLHIAIVALIFVLVAIGHALRPAVGWHVQAGADDTPMSVSWFGLVIAALVWGVVPLRR